MHVCCGHRSAVLTILTWKIVLLQATGHRIGLNKRCFEHRDCAEDQFCAWAECTDGTGHIFACGSCKPCAECSCDTEAVDFECPQSNCPAQPKGVRFLQGEFYNISYFEQDPRYKCVRKFVVSGETFTFLQLPVYALHPATTAELNPPEFLLEQCPSYNRFGVLKYAADNVTNGAFVIDATISSQGMACLQGNLPLQH